MRIRSQPGMNVDIDDHGKVFSQPYTEHLLPIIHPG